MFNSSSFTKLLQVKLCLQKVNLSNNDALVYKTMGEVNFG